MAKMRGGGGGYHTKDKATPSGLQLIRVRYTSHPDTISSFNANGNCSDSRGDHKAE